MVESCWLHFDRKRLVATLSLAATILSHIKQSVSPLNSSSVLPIISFWFYRIYFKMWNIHCWKINADNTVVTKELIYKHTLWSTIVLDVCRPTLQHVSLLNSDTSIHFLCNILVPHTIFNTCQFSSKSQNIPRLCPVCIDWKYGGPFLDILVSLWYQIWPID